MLALLVDIEDRAPNFFLYVLLYIAMLLCFVAIVVVVFIIVAAVVMALVCATPSSIHARLTSQSEPTEATDVTTIPRIIVATCKDKAKIPFKVYDNWNTFAPNYLHVVFDDKEALEFLESHYPSYVVKKYLDLGGAHRADLFRYCYLYRFGGVYIDVKTELIRDMDDIIKSRPHVDLYTVLSIHDDTMYQGIIAAKPNQTLFLELIDVLVSTPSSTLRQNYLINTRDFYRVLKKASTSAALGAGESVFVQPGRPSRSATAYLFVEKCSRRACDCSDGLDRYGLCCHVHDEAATGDVVFKTRYSDYPW